MIRKTMRVGEVRTSIKLEGVFWSYLKELADDRRMRLSSLINEVSAAHPDRSNLASTLRTFSLSHAKLRTRNLQAQLDKLALAGNTQDLTRVLEACPLPCLMLDPERAIRQLNRAFALWLNVDPKAAVGLRLDNIMILRAASLREAWAGIHDGRLMRTNFTATYVSPGKVRTAQAMAVALAAPDGQRRGCAVLFETLAGRA